jgi:hypothetical protein
MHRADGHIPKGGKTPCKRLPFTVQKTAFRHVKGGIPEYGRHRPAFRKHNALTAST